MTESEPFNPYRKQQWMVPMDDDDERMPLSTKDDRLPAPHEPYVWGKMTYDHGWRYGILLDTGHMLCVHGPTRHYEGPDGATWIDFELLDDYPIKRKQLEDAGIKMVIAPTKRATIGVALLRIVAALELSDT